MRVLSVAPELFPLIKTGGLADVTGALPAALKPHGVEMRSLVPGYPAVMQQLKREREVWQNADFFGGPARLLSATLAGLSLYVLDAPHFFGRAGNPYLTPEGRDWPDNPQRFAAFSYAAALIGQGAVPGYTPDLLHAHDWQSALAPAYLHWAGGARPATILTIHNLAFQGLAPAELLSTLQLPASDFTAAGFEYYQQIGFLKAGLNYADRITTVSPSYAAEILTPEGGMGLDGVLRARGAALSGILNGIDTKVWNPEDNAFLPATFSAADQTGRAACKLALQQHFNLQPDPDRMVFGVVSRLTSQKGLDILLGCLDAILNAGAQLAVLGSGDANLQNGFTQAAQNHPGHVGTILGYDEKLAHLLQAGSDVVAVPSRFEPCGLTQLCALRYGAIPLVSRVGGLADTVIDANEAALAASVATGLQFAPVNEAALRGAIARAVALWKRKDVWQRMRTRAMQSDVSWTGPAAHYAALYAEAIAAR